MSRLQTSEEVGKGPGGQVRGDKSREAASQVLGPCDEGGGHHCTCNDTMRRVPQVEVSPLENAIQVVENKNQELRALIGQYQHKQAHGNVSLLSMCLNGVIDAAVNGGIARYQEVSPPTGQPGCESDLGLLFLFQPTQLALPGPATAAGGCPGMRL